MNDDHQELQKAINTNMARKAKLVQEIRKLKTETGMKLETIARAQEKKNALQMEAKDRDKQHQKIEADLKNKLELRKKTNQMVPHRSIESFGNLEEKEKLIEKFTYLLESKINNSVSKYVKSYCNEAYGLKENSDMDEEHDSYLKSQHVSVLMVVLEDLIPVRKKDDRSMTYSEETPLADEEKPNTIKQQYLTTFRIAQQTTIDEVKEQACAFWGKKLENYEFFDEKGEKFEDEKREGKTVEKFFKSRKAHMTQMMVVMKQAKKKGPNTYDLDESIDNGQKGIEISDSADLSHHMDAYSNYNKMLPKLKPFIPISKAKTEEKEKYFKSLNNPRTFGENHFCIFFILAVMMATSILSILLQKNVQTEYSTIKNIQVLAEVEDISSIFSYEDFFNKIVSNLARYFPRNLSKDVLQQSGFRFYKPLTFRQYRVQSTPCKIDVPGFTCYHEQYDAYTRETKDITFIERDFTTSKLKFSLLDEDDPFKGVIQGTFGEYSLEAYTVSFDPATTYLVDFLKSMCTMLTNVQKNKDVCKSALRNYVPQSYLDSLQNTDITFVGTNTRAIRISINLYDIEDSSFILLEPLFEFTPIGTIMTTVNRILVYKPNLKQNTDAPQGTLGIISVICATFLLIFVLYNLFAQGNGRLNLNYFITMQGMLNLAIIIMTYVSHTLMSKFNGLNIGHDQLRDNVDIQAMTDLAKKYDFIFIIKSVLVGLISTRLLLLLKLNTRVETIIRTYEKAIPLAISILISVGPFLLGLAFLGHYALGRENPLFQFYGASVLGIALSTFGIAFQLPWKFNAGEVIIIFVSFFFLYLMILSLFAAINVENYRQIMLDYGKDYHAQYTWKYRDYLQWLVTWVPRRVKQSQLLKVKDNLRSFKENVGDKLQSVGTKFTQLRSPTIKNKPKDATLSPDQIQVQMSSNLG